MPAPDVSALLASLDLTKLVQVAGTAVVAHKPGSIRLDGYPRLVYAPSQHGPGVRTEDRGIPVADICLAFAAHPDAAAVAASLGTTPDHVLEAVAYAAEAGATTPAE